MPGLVPVTRLLVVEDDEEIGSLLVSGLRASGYEVTWCRDGRAAVDEASPPRSIELILLDVGLPDLDGVEVCRDLRALQPGSVIVMLTARSDEMDVIAGLESGADDYLTKPFRMVELLARIRAHLRRGSVSAPGDTTDLYVLGTSSVDRAARRCLVGGVEVTLRTKEFDLLLRLAQSAGTAVSRETLMADVWDEHWWGSTKTLDVHIASLRRKLSEGAQSSGQNEPVITTLRGHGYRLEAPK